MTHPADRRDHAARPALQEPSSQQPALQQPAREAGPAHASSVRTRSRRMLGHAVRRIASHLPPPRDRALRALARETRVLLTGRRPPRRPTPEEEERRDVVRVAERALEHGEPEAALRHLDAYLAVNPDDPKVVAARRGPLAAMGEVSEMIRTYRRMRRGKGGARLARLQRIWAGRAIEAADGWLPRIPGPPRPMDPVEGRVLHLLKESVPWLENGFTLRSRYGMLATMGEGWTPSVVTSLGFPRVLGVTDPPARETVDGIPHHRLDLGPYYAEDTPADRVLEDQAWLSAAVVREVRPQLIHAASGHRGYETALVAYALREHLRVPVVYEVRSFFESTWSPDPRWAERGEQYHLRHRAETRAMLAADHLVTIATAMRDDIVARGIDPARITVIPNGVDTDLLRPMPPDPELLARYGLTGRFVFGYVSNLDHPRENQELLVRATRLLVDRGHDVRCLIVGDGRRRQALEVEAVRAGVRQHVVFAGRVPHDDVAAHYALFDAFVVPRRDEHAARTVTPLKPFEAMAVGRPLVVADLPALREIVAPDERGLAFEPDDAVALARVLEQLIANPALGDRLGEAAREWVVRERGWAGNGPRYTAAYRQALDRWAHAQRAVA